MPRRPSIARWSEGQADDRFGESAADGQFEAAEPVKFTGDVIGAIACRWTAGTAMSPERVTATLRAAALAAAAPVRAVLDRAAPEAVDRAWTDLLGESAGAAAVRESTARAARAPFPVLIEGASGHSRTSDFIEVFGEAAVDDGDGAVAGAGKP